MFSHIMLGTNDLDRSKAFYDAVLGTLDVPPRRCRPLPHLLAHQDGRVLGEPAHRRPARHGRQRQHHRLCLPVARAGRCLARGRSGQRRHDLRRPARPARRPGRQALSGLPARSGREQALRAVPRAARLIEPGRACAGVCQRGSSTRMFSVSCQPFCWPVSQGRR